MKKKTVGLLIVIVLALSAVAVPGTLAQDDLGTAHGGHFFVPTAGF